MPGLGRRASLAVVRGGSRARPARGGRNRSRGDVAGARERSQPPDDGRDRPPARRAEDARRQADRGGGVAGRADLRRAAAPPPRSGGPARGPRRAGAPARRDDPRPLRPGVGGHPRPALRPPRRRARRGPRRGRHLRRAPRCRAGGRRALPRRVGQRGAGGAHRRHRPRGTLGRRRAAGGGAAGAVRRPRRLVGQDGRDPARASPAGSRPLPEDRTLRALRQRRDPRGAARRRLEPHRGRRVDAGHAGGQARGEAVHQVARGGVGESAAGELSGAGLPAGGAHLRPPALVPRARLDRAGRGDPDPRPRPGHRPQPAAAARPRPARADPRRVREDGPAARAGRGPRAGAAGGAARRSRRPAAGRPAGRRGTPRRHALGHARPAGTGRAGGDRGPAAPPAPARRPSRPRTAPRRRGRPTGSRCSRRWRATASTRTARRPPGSSGAACSTRA